MKLSIILVFLSFTFSYSFAQSGYGYGNNREIITKNKVKILSIYYFQTELDSTLTNVNTYDSLGGQLTSKTISRVGNITNSDTFIYDKNHYLIKQINSDGNKIRHEMTFTNNANGKILNQTLLGDSIYYQTINTYDNNSRFIKSKGYDNNGDTMFINTLYNRKGLMAKNIISSKQNGTTVITYDYNSRGKVLSTKTTSRDSKYFSEFKYYVNGNNYETITIVTSNKQGNVNKTVYSFYSNGLTFEKTFFINNKPITIEKAYYSYY